MVDHVRRAAARRARGQARRRWSPPRLGRGHRPGEVEISTFSGHIPSVTAPTVEPRDSGAARSTLGTGAACAELVARAAASTTVVGSVVLAVLVVAVGLAAAAFALVG